MYIFLTQYFADKVNNQFDPTPSSKVLSYEPSNSTLLFSCPLICVLFPFIPFLETLIFFLFPYLFAQTLL